MEKLQELISFLLSKGMDHKKIDIDVLFAIIEYFGKEAETEQLRIHDLVGRSEQLVAFLKWVGDGYDFENNAEKIVKEYIDEI
jgi:hypothetical protein